MSTRILVVSDRLGDGARLRHVLGPDAEVVSVSRPAEIAAGLDGVTLVVAAGGCAASATTLAAVGAACTPCPVLALTAQRPAGSPALAFVQGPDPDDEDLAVLVMSLASGRPVGHRTERRPLDLDEARRRGRAFSASRRVGAAPDLATAEAVSADVLSDLIDADGARCWFYDASAGELWSAVATDEGAPADRGLVGWVARTGAIVAVASAGRDPRWDRARDRVDGDARVLVVPLLGAAGAVEAVWLAHRRPSQPPFGDAEVASACALAELVAPLLPQIAEHADAQDLVAEGDADVLFRREAGEAQRGDAWGELVLGSPGWLRWVHVGLVATMLIALSYMIVGRVHTFARGPAVVRQTARTEVTARVAGNVITARGTPGAAIAAGDVLVVLDDAPQAAEVTRLQAEFEARLRERMLSPSTAAVGAAVTAARTEIERARAQLDERVLRAPRPGIIGDIRVRPGQRIEPGDVVASVVDPASPVEVIALIPSGDRPRLTRGQRLRLELTGFHHTYQDVIVDSIAAEAIGPEEARRYLGSVGAAAQLAGPVVVVKARLPSGFRSDGHDYRYVDGMSAMAEIQVGSERIVHALVPGLGGR
ncbi:MAG: HlyD family efflux transporter periplasmic adaptor subunit [Myxococcales bacterium]|nr:HlyD family efflux transporter periplasmic adaptor subunit [Myxococcales bacterium]